MATRQDWLPQNHEALYNQATQTLSYLTQTANRTRMGFAADTPQGQWLTTGLLPKMGDFSTAYNNWKNPAERTPVKTTKLTEAEDAFKPEFRKLYTGFLKDSPLVTDDDLVAMGLPARSSGRHPAPVATTYPDFDIDSGTIRRLIIHFSDQGSKKSKAKPAGQHGAEIRWAILDTPPMDMAELAHSEFDTRTPFTLEFHGHERGKTVYFCLCWENTRGEKGPWSDIQSAIIP
jgi:hypothetical protein